MLFLQPDRFSLLQKGLVLIAVPLLFESVFVGGLFMLLRRADMQVERAQHTQKLITEVQRLQSSVTRGAYSVAMLAVRKTKLTESLSEAAVKAMPESLADIRRLTSSDAHESEIVGNLVRQSEDMQTELTQLRNVVDNSGFSSAMQYLMTAAHDIDRLVAEVVHTSDELCSYDFTLNRVAVESTDSTRQGLILWLAGGMIANLVLALFLVWYLHRSTVRRLSILMQNTRRLQAREPLLEPLSGRDEIAELDKVFRSMADSLGEMERTKEEFYAMIAHDLRSPLSATMLTLEMAGQGIFGPLPETAAERLTVAGDNCKRLVEMVNQLLDVAKLESATVQLNLRELSAAELVEACTASVRALAEKKQIDLQVKAGAPARFSGDTHELTRVLVNLLSNAIKFSAPGKVIILETRVEKDWLEFRVSDQGPGIAPEKLGTVFERFAQVVGDRQQRPEGSGLGLYICKLIVEAHGGTIGVGSQVGIGSTFWVRLPL